MTVQHINNINCSSYVLLRKLRLLVTTYLLLLVGVGVRIMSVAQFPFSRSILLLVSSVSNFLKGTGTLFLAACSAFRFWVQYEVDLDFLILKDTFVLYFRIAFPLICLQSVCVCLCVAVLVTLQWNLWMCVSAWGELQGCRAVCAEEIRVGGCWYTATINHGLVAAWPPKPPKLWWGKSKFFRGRCNDSRGKHSCSCRKQHSVELFLWFRGFSYLQISQSETWKDRRRKKHSLATLLDATAVQLPNQPIA